MALRETITVSITPELKAFIRERLATGRYASTSEVVHVGLRALERFEANLPPKAQDARSATTNV
ncbi:type II toxin-antitoxin system ParD family antitoxin [Methylobacterium sp. J-076]|uniref:type II toxin-antitoxin system ParD family antitoxin n=1 Tax=Methylobacterium sp. J-076 TaxID=2836655 RepID=UPI001FB955D3|nr:type II toxin-antitoxin system ParD family antitoxin [Methylobacterium sp. J-076]MCJ2011778.1 type II toxin-antitoxin system ParD family antitoxin [Methylobacterium sp. J-076]